MESERPICLAMANGDEINLLLHREHSIIDEVLFSLAMFDERDRRATYRVIARRKSSRFSIYPIAGGEVSVLSGFRDLG